jgi:uncharacterized protein YcfJ
MKKILLAFIASILMVGCATVPSSPPEQGTVVGFQNIVFQEYQPNVGGAVLGGVAGGVIGHQFGGGDGKTAMTVLGSVIGMGVGSQVNSMHSVQGYEITVRKNDGSIFKANIKDQTFYIGQIVNFTIRGNQVTIF